MTPRPHTTTEEGAPLHPTTSPHEPYTPTGNPNANAGDNKHQKAAIRDTAHKEHNHTYTYIHGFRSHQRHRLDNNCLPKPPTQNTNNAATKCLGHHNDHPDNLKQ
ncbi:Hypothetical predicted protein [Pelobates cultripes]|uniref:Uncharacterized protein n=1 Tax=Pelobates cultripes TaxID=61616 RepID=A0AAD1VV86_PELCU|nr:Hypothetical predicted protein [Pelobates cultripes]